MSISRDLFGRKIHRANTLISIYYKYYREFLSVKKISSFIFNLCCKVITAAWKVNYSLSKIRKMHEREVRSKPRSVARDAILARKVPARMTS